MRVSVVDFLNARPLVWGLLRNPPPGFEVSRDMPSVCADRLRDGSADAGLIPSIELWRIPDLQRVAGLGIAADSEVRSVLLVSNVSREKIRSVRFDPSSRTSAALVRVLLKRRYGITVESRDEGADAELIIGDPAMKADLRGRVVLDLASEWRSLTGFPFVFAVWAARKEAWSEELRSALFDSYRASVCAFDAMIDSEIEAFRDNAGARLSRALVEDYLRHCLHYELTEADENGLNLFRCWAREDGLIGGTP
ncbi:MAG: menaquinone biosynthetic enzyme MqnA/MqnD family protein [Thermoanaerobaculia bacterium]